MHLHLCEFCHQASRFLAIIFYQRLKLIFLPTKKSFLLGMCDLLVVIVGIAVYLLFVCLSVCQQKCYIAFTLLQCVLFSSPNFCVDKKKLWCWLQFCVFYFVTNAISVSSSFITAIAIVTILLLLFLAIVNVCS